MATYNLAAILKNPSNDAEFLLLKQTPPPKFGDPEYDSFVDSDLWDLPSTKLNLLPGESESPGVVVDGVESVLEKVNLLEFDLGSGISRVLGQVGLKADDVEGWKFFKLVEEADFGPGSPVNTVYVAGNVVTGEQSLSEQSKWMSTQSCLTMLVDVKPCSDRVGPLVVTGLINDTEQGTTVQTSLHYQEYPPGVIILPMKSRTAKPFRTTNLVIFAPSSATNECDGYSYIARGDALIVDPGCQTNLHDELFKVVAALSRKLVVFVTHHHHDHVDGLSVIQKCNPDATLLGHENTLRRIKKDDWSLGYTSVSGGEDICIGGQRLNVVYAPGHTDGHLALLHVNTHSLIVGDHCVGQGSTLLDISSGGNMADYFQSTYKFIDLSPHVLIPMHGRLNLWPKNMLCGYLKNRRSRESAILKAIENGAKTLIDIVASVYAGVDTGLWFFASYNVRLHVEHLAQQNKLPNGFLISKFQKSCGLHFLSRWTWAYLTTGFMSRYKKLSTHKLLIGGAVASFAIFYTFRDRLKLNKGLQLGG
ncbi:hypothetical protein Tsubulata_040345 [Turnera subulata]|uniref:Metallo-beta-lactamase domain-containing protein n=1 Tax=Turnera subulata TaxID=218843 RepID=A0A9Q0F3T6_9ROSI|nr:hypothetical protein Tsubulata_040345 [Turnera subulata]